MHRTALWEQSDRLHRRTRIHKQRAAGRAPQPCSTQNVHSWPPSDGVPPSRNWKEEWQSPRIPPSCTDRRPCHEEEPGRGIPPAGRRRAGSTHTTNTSKEIQQEHRHDTSHSLSTPGGTQTQPQPQSHTHRDGASLQRKYRG